ncbi:MAG: hypothetical protein Q8O31_04805 [Rhodocyclaceae bacterium]|nr:hypothetical protein [Rhodocyclaceae bacterium]
MTISDTVNDFDENNHVAPDLVFSIKENPVRKRRYLWNSAKVIHCYSDLASRCL